VSRDLAKDVAIMSEISNIGMSNLYAATQRVGSTASGAPMDRLGPNEALGESDPVEFSRMGRMLAGAADTSSLRQAKIQALRAEIAAGTFESQERIDGTVDQLIKALN
jgi:hypothetical protein